MTVNSRNPFSCLVVKFGGSSLSDGERLSRAASAVAREVKRGVRVAVVVSAMGKTTDKLLETVKKSSNSNGPSIRDVDDILSMGERTSARIFRAALVSSGVESRHFDPADEDWPIITDSAYGNAEPNLKLCHERIREHVQPLMEKRIVPVIPGFIGRTEDGETTTIGRGGSDTTAFILAKALGAREVVLVTDVDGILSADPKIIGNPKRLEEVTADTLAGLADSGTKFIHKKALKYKDENIDVRVISHIHSRLDAEGTLVKGSFSKELDVELASSKPVLMLTVVGRGISDEPKVIHEIVEVVRSGGSPLLGMSANHNSLILYLPDECPQSILESVHSVVLKHRETLAMAVRKGMALLVVRGVGLEETPGLIGGIAEPLRQNHINIFGILTITSSIQVFVDWKDCDKAISLTRKSLRKEVKA